MSYFFVSTGLGLVKLDKMGEHWMMRLDAHVDSGQGEQLCSKSHTIWTSCFTSNKGLF